MDMDTQVQIQNEAIFISHSANTLAKVMNPTILPLTKGKLVRQTGFISLFIGTGLGEGKLLIQTC